MSARIPSPIVGRVLEICLRELGAVAVANQLDVTPVLLDMWQTGQASMPRDKFEKLVDVLITLNPSWEDWDK